MNSSTPSPSSRRATRRSWLSGVLITSGAGAFGLHRLGIANAEKAAAELHRLEAEAAARRAAAEAERRALEKRLRAMLSREAREELDKAGQNDAALSSQTLAGLKARISSLETEASRGIPAITQNLGRVKGIFWSILLMAQDQVTGSAEMQKMLSAALAPVSSPLARMSAEAEAGLASLAQGVSQHSNEMAARLLTVINQTSQQHSGVLPELGKSLQPACAAIQSGHISLGFATAALPLEIVTVVKVLRFLSRVLSKWVGRAAATGAASLGLIAADGPLPIGDAVALLTSLGFSAWALWDVYHLSKWVPEEISSNLYSAIATHRDQILTSVECENVRLRQHAAESREQALQPLLAQQ